MNQTLALAYYTNQAANRRHFQTLFFAVCGFTWSFGLAVFAIVLQSPIGAGTGTVTSLLSSGLVLTGGSFIAHRLLLRERSALREMITIWREITLQDAPPVNSGFRPGAMAIACMVQALIGCGLIGLALAQ